MHALESLSMVVALMARCSALSYLLRHRCSTAVRDCDEDAPYRCGRFPNTSGNPFKTTPVSSFEVRLDGERVTLPARGDSFLTVLRIEERRSRLADQCRTDALPHGGNKGG